LSESGHRRVVSAGILLLVVPLVLSVINYARGVETQPFLAAAKPGTRCVLDATIMRHRHMNYLKDLRDRVVRSGDRAPGVGVDTRGMMISCGQCHADRSQFCDKCHSRAGVTPDCFGCHSY
jgi:hypothetical protein